MAWCLTFTSTNLDTWGSCTLCAAGIGETGLWLFYQFQRQTIRTLVAHTQRTLLGVAQKILTKVNKCLVFRLHGMMPDVHFNKFRHLRLLYSVCCRHWWDWTLTLLPVSASDHPNIGSAHRKNPSWRCTKKLTKVNKCLVFRLHGMMPDVHFNKFRHLRLLYSVCCRHWWDWTLLPISSKIWWNVCWTAFIAVLDWCLRCRNVGSESHLTMKTWQREMQWPNLWTCSFLKYLVHGTAPVRQNWESRKRWFHTSGV